MIPALVIFVTSEVTLIPSDLELAAGLDAR